MSRRQVLLRFRSSAFGFIQHAVTHAERGNRFAVLEALEDLERLVDNHVAEAEVTVFPVVTCAVLQ